jgi:hypothetical protein
VWVAGQTVRNQVLRVTQESSSKRAVVPACGVAQQARLLRHSSVAALDDALLAGLPLDCHLSLRARLTGSRLRVSSEQLLLLSEASLRTTWRELLEFASEQRAPRSSARTRGAPRAKTKSLHLPYYAPGREPHARAPGCRPCAPSAGADRSGIARAARRTATPWARRGAVHSSPVRHGRSATHKAAGRTRANALSLQQRGLA